MQSVNNHEEWSVFRFTLIVSKARFSFFFKKNLVWDYYEKLKQTPSTVVD